MIRKLILEAKTLNDFHIYEEIGKGKHSVVYKGRKKQSLQYVAIRSVEKSQRSKLLNEASSEHSCCAFVILFLLVQQFVRLQLLLLLFTGSHRNMCMLF